MASFLAVAKTAKPAPSRLAVERAQRRLSVAQGKRRHPVAREKLFSTTRLQGFSKIAHEMLSHAFRQASLKHRPDHGGDPENMRRVYVVRDLFLRAIHKA